MKEMAECLPGIVKEMPAMPVPSDSLLAGRNQHYSTRILKELLGEVPPDALKLLGVTEKDLCIPILTYVFGEAQLGGTVAVVSFARLRQEFHGLAPDRPLFLERTRKECLHELGHTYGLIHCKSRECVMSLSNTVFDVDGKGRDFCRYCRSIVASKAGERRKP
jgi:archaemetzincin